MGRKKKYELPSGSIRKLVYDHTDSDGKRHYVSFSGDSLQEINIEISQYKLGKKKKETERKKTQKVEKETGIPLTVEQAVRQYIDANVGTLSPSTIRGYEAIFREHIKGSAFGKLHIAKVTNVDLQKWISELSMTTSARGAALSSKTIHNEFGLVEAVIHKYLPDFRMNVTLPKKQPPHQYIPDSQDVARVIAGITRPDLLAAVLLYIAGPARRSEICALEWSDVSGTRISINKAMVLTTDNKWVIKPYPKTEDSIRVIDYPQSVIDLLPEKTGDRIINMNPAMISNEFSRTVKRLGLPHFSIHSLRHYSASALHAAGIPDLYITSRGGWSRSSNVMKSVYQGTLDSETVKQNEKINQYFDDLISGIDI